ncbi:MAG: hypothetical protein K9N00_06515 [Candidatus Marinimicrobia bacterium]|nr:hypothetical protein [Candidatus Neomarinimicrobiota bacterium]
MTENKIDKEKLIDKICSSVIFSNSVFYSKILKYLYECYKKDKVPTEMEVAFDVFNKDKDFDPGHDTIIRVYFYRLRRKLKEYYKKEGKKDPLKITIPKGSYHIEFGDNSDNGGTDKNNPPQKYNKKYKIFRNATFILSFLVILALVYIIFNDVNVNNQKRISDISKNHKLWNTFFNNRYNSKVVVGDFFVFHEYDKTLDRDRRIQDYVINYEEQFTEFKRNHPNRDLDKWVLGELPHNSIFNIADLQRIFLSYDKEMDIDFTTEIDINYIKNKNVIYVGEFKNLRSLSDLIEPLPIEYETLPDWQGNFRYIDQDSSATLKARHDWDVNRYVVDLSILAKLPGLENENYIIVAGFGYNSQIKTIEMICHDEELKKFEQEIKEINGNIPKYYVSVFKITGFDRASCAAQLKWFYEIDKENYITQLTQGIAE